MKRQSTLQRVKAVQKERDSLTGDKEAAEAYLQKERECLGAQSVLAQVLAAQAKVGCGWVGAGRGGRQPWHHSVLSQCRLCVGGLCRRASSRTGQPKELPGAG